MDIIILAALAVYIFLKLRKQLGKVDDKQKRDAIRHFIKEQTKFQSGKSKTQNNQQGVVVDIADGKIVKNEDAPQIDKRSQQILDSIDDSIKEKLNPILDNIGISIVAFVDGANKAFEVIIEAFAKADIKSLKPILSEKILHQFTSAIKDREVKDQFLNTKIVAIDQSDIISAKVIKNYASITVKFISRQINYITDKEGKVLEGSKEEVNNISDVWTFKKDNRSKNPNWFVAATTS